MPGNLGCSIHPTANAAAADTGLPFPCALLVLFHLDVDEGKMWVSACLPGTGKSIGNVEFDVAGEEFCVFPAVQPVPHARIHVMRFD
jgi:hypothetical protein